MGEEDWRLRELETEPPLTWLLGHLRLVWRRLRGPAPELLPSDIVPADAWPVCPECIVAHHPVLSYCPACGEPVGPYRALRYLDLVWIWGKGLWRLVERRSVSRVVWAGLVCLGLDELNSGVTMVLAHWFPGETLGREYAWAVRAEGALMAATGIVYALVGVRFLSAAKRTWGSWRELAEDEAAESQD
jgi:hypothetical protein